MEKFVCEDKMERPVVLILVVVANIQMGATLR